MNFKTLVEGESHKACLLSMLMQEKAKGWNSVISWIWEQESPQIAKIFTGKHSV
jgi:hypothetical protein